MGQYYRKIDTENERLLEEGKAEFVAVRNAGNFRQHKAKFFRIDDVPGFIHEEFEEFDGNNWKEFFGQVMPAPASGNYYFELYSEESLKLTFETLFDADYEGFNGFSDKLEYVKDTENFDKFYDSELSAIAEVL